MDPTTGAIIASASAAPGGGLIAILIALLLVIVPFIVKFWNWSKETSAQGELYRQLSSMVQNQRKELDELYENRKKDQEEIFDLRRKVDNLIGYEQQAETLKRKLDQKDQIIAERDKKIANLLDELLRMKDRVHSLEIRLKIDEEKFCQGCEFKNVRDIPPLFSNREGTT